MAKMNNLAYDYSVYEPTPKREPEKRIQVKKTTKVKTISASKSLITAIAALFLFCSILYGKVEMSRLYNESADSRNQLALLNSENVRMQTAIEGKTALKNVEIYAEEVLGLQKLDKAQIQYVELQKDNIIEVVEKKNQNIFVAIKNWVGDVVEYIGT